MIQHFVTPEQAVELNKLGFNEMCLRQVNPNSHVIWRFIDSEDSVDVLDILKKPMHENWIGVPLRSQVFEWFREGYLLFHNINVDQTMEPKFCYSISRYESAQFMESWTDVVFNSDLYYEYGRAEKDCIDKLIEIVKSEI